MDAAVLHDEPQAYTRNSHTELDSMQTSGVMESSGDGPVFSSSGAGGEEWELLLRQILGEEEGAASLALAVVTGSPGEEPSRSEIVINLTTPEACQVVVNVTSSEGQGSGTIAPGTQKSDPIRELFRTRLVFQFTS